MKTYSIEKFRGLQIQANSFQDATGMLEKADNVVLSRDNIIQKRRGFKSSYYLPENMNALTDYSGFEFGIGNAIYRFDPTATGTASVITGNTTVAVRKDSHGVADGYISDFLVTDEDFVASFTNRYADFVGQRAAVSTIALTATASGSVVVCDLTDHGAETGDTIDVLTSDVGAVLSDVSITVIDDDSFYYTDATATGTGTVTAVFGDVFYVTGLPTPIDSATGTATWTGYSKLGGVTFTTSGYVPVLRTGKNLYWQAAEGLHSIESVTGDVRKSGVPPGLDTDAYLSGTSGGVAPNSQVAYRVVFGRKDANDTIHLSSPSDVVLLANVPTEVTSLSYASGTGVLTVTDANHIVEDGDLVYLYDVVCDPSGEAPSDGSSLAVTGVVSGTSFEIDLDDLGVSPTTVTSISYSTRKTATVYAGVAPDMDYTGFYQVYRSESVDAEAVPDSRYKLVEQVDLDVSDISRRFVEYTDSLPFEIIQSNQELYTNATQEGDSQANARPPLASDMALFKGYTFFADCTQYRYLSLDLIQTTDLANGDTITIAGETYEFRGDASNSAIGNDITESSASQSGSTVTVTQVAHGLTSDDIIKVISSTNDANPNFSLVSVGNYSITVSGPDTFTIPVSNSTTATGNITYEARYNSTSGYFIVTLTEPSDTAAETLAESIDWTARSLVKACNRNSTKLFAQYVSGIDESPGKMLFYAQALDEATYAAIASDSTVGGCFSPILPTSGTGVSDTQQEDANALYASKYLEAEAVPIVNRFPIGSQEASILRVVALRDSLIIFKEDGVYRLNGDSLNNFTATALDTTVILKAQRSVAVLNNSVYALTNQGVVQVTDTSVRIISRPIEPLLTAVLGNSNLAAYTAGVAYESERLYLLTTIGINATESYGSVTYCYNYLTDAWTTWSGNALAYAGNVSGVSDKLSIISASDKMDVLMERKEQNKVDYTGVSGAMQVFKKRLSQFSTTAGSTEVCIAVSEGHGVNVGDVISISGIDTALASYFSSSIEGSYVVKSVTDKIICFDAAIAATLGGIGSAYWNRGFPNALVIAGIAVGTNRLGIIAPTAMLEVGQSIQINSIGADFPGSDPISDGFADLNDVLGYRVIKEILSDGLFTVRTDSISAATGNCISYIYISDKNGVDNIVTAQAGFQIQPGEALVSENRIYKILDVEKFDSTRYVLTLSNDAGFTDTSLVYWHDNYQSRVRLAPLTMGTGQLKQFSEFQAWFRNENSCSQLIVNFATDSRYSDKPTDWSTYLGTPEGFVVYGGWGAQAWGKFPWGGGTSVVLDYATGPAVPFRTWIPQASYLATFIQPELVHQVAGEPMELQSVTLIGKSATHKVSK